MSSPKGGSFFDHFRLDEDGWCCCHWEDEKGCDHCDSYRKNNPSMSWPALCGICCVSTQKTFCVRWQSLSNTNLWRCTMLLSWSRIEAVRWTYYVTTSLQLPGQGIDVNQGEHFKRRAHWQQGLDPRLATRRVGRKQTAESNGPLGSCSGKIGGAGLDVVEGEDVYFHTDWSSKVEAWSRWYQRARRFLVSWLMALWPLGNILVLPEFWASP